VALAAQRPQHPGLLLRQHPPEHHAVGHRRRDCVVVEVAGVDDVAPHTHRRGHRRHGAGVVAGDDAQADALGGEVGDGVRGVRTDPLGEDHEAGGAEGRGQGVIDG